MALSNRLRTYGPRSLPLVSPFLYTSLKRHGGEARSKQSHVHVHDHEEERAPSTAREFERVAEEKKQGLASQTIEKAYDAVDEATSGASNLESIKNSYQRHHPGADYHKKPDKD